MDKNNEMLHPTNVYAVRDMVAEVYMPPVIADKDNVMIRNFGDAVIGGKTPLSNHPEDYALMKIGQFDQETGLLVACQPVLLAHASDFVNADKDKDIK